MRFLVPALVALLLQDPQPAAQPLVRLKEGMAWTYVTNSVEGKVKVTGKEKIGEVEAFVLTTEMGDSKSEREFIVSDAAGIRMLRQASGDRVTEYAQPFIRLKLPAAKGDTWEWKGDVGKEKVAVAFTNDGEEEITVPAGKYKAWKVSAVAEIGAVKHAGSNWFAPGVGLVRQESRFESGGKKHENVIELKSFEPGP